MSKKKLLPCPFCGGEARFSTEAGNWINCKSCGAETDYFEQREEAINTWNTREPMQKIAERLEERIVEMKKAVCLLPTQQYEHSLEIVKEEGGLNE